MGLLRQKQKSGPLNCTGRKFLSGRRRFFEKSF